MNPANELANALGIPGRPFGLAVDEKGVVRGTSIPNEITDLFALADKVLISVGVFTARR